MKSIEIIEKINAKKEQIEKRKILIEKIISKHEQEIKGVEDAWLLECAVNNFGYDISSANDKLKDLQNQLLNLELQLEKQLSKENIIKIPVIEQLLEKWGQNITDWYNDATEKKTILEDEEYKLYMQCKKDFGMFCSIKCYIGDEAVLKERKHIKKCTEEEIEFFNETISPFNLKYRKFYFTNNPILYIPDIKKYVDNEIENKRMHLINKVVAITGEITDATGLSVANDGSINGVIIGKRGNAFINTIYAGGYNVQCLHFRVLVREAR